MDTSGASNVPGLDSPGGRSVDRRRCQGAAVGPVFFGQFTRVAGRWLSVRTRLALGWLRPVGLGELTEPLDSPEREEGLSPKREKGLSPKREKGSSPKREEGLSPKGEEGLSPKGEEGLSPKGEEGLSPKGEEGLSPEGEEGFWSLDESEFAFGSGAGSAYATTCPVIATPTQMAATTGMTRTVYREDRIAAPRPDGPPGSINPCHRGA